MRNLITAIVSDDIEECYKSAQEKYGFEGWTEKLAAASTNGEGEAILLANPEAPPKEIRDAFSISPIEQREPVKAFAIIGAERVSEHYFVSLVATFQNLEDAIAGMAKYFEQCDSEFFANLEDDEKEPKES